MRSHIGRIVMHRIQQTTRPYTVYSPGLHLSAASFTRVCFKYRLIITSVVNVPGIFQTLEEPMHPGKGSSHIFTPPNRPHQTDSVDCGNGVRYHTYRRRKCCKNRVLRYRSRSRGNTGLYACWNTWSRQSNPHFRSAQA